MKYLAGHIARITIPVALLFVVPNVFAHATISPVVSNVGKSENYEIRVPAERDSPTVEIKVDFPKGVVVSDFRAEVGGEIELIENSKGVVICAVWRGEPIVTGQSQEFSFTAVNPDKVTSLVWKVTQIHADGVRVRWVGNRQSRFPAPVVEINNS